MQGYLGKRGWKKLTVLQRKEIRDLARLQQRLGKHYPKRYQPEEYVNWNAEIEYERSMGRR
jgi:hypothetical protein